MKALTLPNESFEMGMSFGFCDHFVNKDTTFWTTTATDTGTATVLNAAGGIMQLAPSDGTVADNDEVYLLSTAELFRIAAGKPLYFKTLVQFAQAATNAANVAMGFMDAVAADAITDNGGGLKASFSGACLYCRDGSLNWHAIYSDGATRTVVELNEFGSLTKTAQVAGSAAFQTVEIEIIPKTATLCDVIFKINGSTVLKMNDRTFANATEMHAFLGAKNGTAAQQLVNFDAACAYQKV
jgi:hypothetical protein